MICSHNSVLMDSNNFTNPLVNRWTARTLCRNYRNYLYTLSPHTVIDHEYGVKHHGEITESSQH